MNYGAGGIQRTNRVIPNGPPFDLAAAFNGLSVDTGTGQIVLGNDAGDPGNPAALVSDREIPAGNFRINITNSPASLENLIGASFVVIQNTLNNTVGMITAQGFAQWRGDSTLSQETPGLQMADVGAGMGTYSELRKNGNEWTLGEQGLAGPGYFRQLLIDNQGHLYGFGELDTFFSGMKFIMDATAGTFDLSNAALNAIFSINGTPGFTGTVVAPASITVEGGIVTNVT